MVADIEGMAEVVALTIAEFIRRQVMHLQQILAGFPLLGPKNPRGSPGVADPLIAARLRSRQCRAFHNCARPQAGLLAGRGGAPSRQQQLGRKTGRVFRDYG